MDADDLLKLAKKGKLDDLEACWMDIVAEGGFDLRRLLAVPQILASRGHERDAESLVWYLIDELRQAGQRETAFEAARTAASFLPSSDLLREALSELYVEAYRAREDVDLMARLAFGPADTPLPEGIGSMDNLLAFRPGIYVLDPQHGEVGRVEGFDAERGGVLIRFADSDKLYAGALLARLQQVDQDDFRALRAFESERLSQMAQDDPEELLSLALSTLDRRMELRRLRIYLEPVVGNWSRWWSKARRKLSRSANIGMTPGPAPALFLRSSPLSHGQRMVRRFDGIVAPVARLRAALDIVEEARAHGHIELEALEHVADALARLAAGASDESPHLAFAAFAVAGACRHAAGGVAAGPGPSERVVERTLNDPESLVAAVPDAQVQLVALDALRTYAGEAWPEVCVALMPVAERAVCGFLAGELERAGRADALRDACARIMARGKAHAGALAWLWRSSAAGRLPAGLDLGALTIRLLSAAAALVRVEGLSEAERRERLHELRNALFMRNGAALRRALSAARPEQLAVIKSMAEFNPGLTPQRIEELAVLLRATEPSLFEKPVPPWEQGVIYVTEAGIARRTAELEHLVHVELPRVIQEVGEAASFGDLSENAEYKAAVERRTRLAEQVGRMQEELAEARVIAPEMADVDHVTIGSRVRLYNLATGQEEVITFLGPWDARPAERIYAYNAPLGMKFMGRVVGDVVEFDLEGEQPRRWEVLGIEPAL